MVASPNHLHSSAVSCFTAVLTLASLDSKRSGITLIAGFGSIAPVPYVLIASVTISTAFSVTFLEQTFGQQQGFWFVLTFAGLMNPTETPGPAVYASQAEKVASISTVGRWQNYTDFLEPVWGDLTSFIRRYGYTD